MESAEKGTIADEAVEDVMNKEVAEMKEKIQNFDEQEVELQADEVRKTQKTQKLDEEEVEPHAEEMQRMQKLDQDKVESHAAEVR